jgi:hypothetical protein
MRSYATIRSMLYKGADLIRDIEWVIFDEVAERINLPTSFLNIRLIDRLGTLC